MHTPQIRRKPRLAALRAEYDAAFDTWCQARRELERQRAANADIETLRCFLAIVASAERHYRRKRNLLAESLVEVRDPNGPAGEQLDSPVVLVA